MYQLVGRRNLDFTKDGKRVVGVKLQMLCVESDVEGLACYEPFVAIDSVAYQQAVSCSFGDVDVQFDHKKKIISIVAK